MYPCRLLGVYSKGRVPQGYKSHARLTRKTHFLLGLFTHEVKRSMGVTMATQPGRVLRYEVGLGYGARRRVVGRGSRVRIHDYSK